MATPVSDELIVESNITGFNKFWFTTTEFKDSENIDLDFFYCNVRTERINRIRRIHLTIDKLCPLLKNLTCLSKYESLEHLELDLYRLEHQHLTLKNLKILSLNERQPNQDTTKLFRICAPNLTKLRCSQFPSYFRLLTATGDFSINKCESVEVLETEAPLSTFKDEKRFNFKSLKKLYVVNIDKIDKGDNYKEVVLKALPKLKMIYFYFRDGCLTADMLKMLQGKLKPLIMVTKGAIKIYVMGVRVTFDTLLRFPTIDSFPQTSGFLNAIINIQFSSSSREIVPHSIYYNHTTVVDATIKSLKNKQDHFCVADVFNSIQAKLTKRFFNIQVAIFDGSELTYLDHDQINSLLNATKGLAVLSLRNCSVNEEFFNHIPYLDYLEVLEIEDDKAINFDFNFVTKFNYIQSIKIKSRHLNSKIPAFLFNCPDAHKIKRFKKFEYKKMKPGLHFTAEQAGSTHYLIKKYKICLIRIRADKRQEVTYSENLDLEQLLNYLNENSFIFDLPLLN